MAVALTPAQLSTVNGGGAAGTTANETVSADRFLRLLVAQMQNQDPLNPMDNAQVTSQMAQINTVSGIEKLNTTFQGLNSQFVGLQLMQGASLVGREVSVDGDRLAVAEGRAKGGFELASAADKVKLEILTPGGQVFQTVDLGGRAAGRQAFDAEAAKLDPATNWRFRISATQAGNAVTATTQALDTVQSVGTRDGQLVLDLRRGGSVSYADVTAVH